MNLFVNFSFSKFLLIFTCAVSWCGSAFVDPRWNTGVLPEKEVIRIKEALKNVTYLLRDRSKNEWFPLHNEDAIPQSMWHPNGAVKLIIHGYTINASENLFEKLDEQNLWALGQEYADSNNSLNVFIVDWTILSTEPLQRYYEASEATPYVGELVARFLMRLANQSFITDWDSVHIIGFSLGGHTAGIAGTKIQELAGVKIGRITGIDPAGPNFEVDGNLPDNIKRVLDKSDAKFVDIIHCNMRRPEKSILGRLGTFAQCGHVDFYPSGGEAQPMCTRKFDMSTKPCSHLYCPKYLMESIRNPRVACPCKDWDTYKNGKCKCTLENGGVFMGDPCPVTASGKYYINSK